LSILTGDEEQRIPWQAFFTAQLGYFPALTIPAVHEWALAPKEAAEKEAPLLTRAICLYAGMDNGG